MSLERDLFGAGRPTDEKVRVLVADDDPASRHVLTRVLRRSTHLEVTTSISYQQLLHRRPLGGVDVVVLVSAPHENTMEQVRQLASREVCVLLIATGWNKCRLDAAFAADATGCLVKDPKAAGAAAAVRAVASGHTVLSPELRTLYVQRPPAVPGFPTNGAEELLPALTPREQEVLRNLAEGMSTAETAARLRVSPATVKSHVSGPRPGCCGWP
ncbi:LuxR C-terminal-related transcriptional regulator [Streptomyces sp. NBC_01754]|uniref:response regulator transcription factor n=1 Tax=Streptomyces sp. NBC_01754 TaxID=2975930 RepID=UPI002DD7DC19|nr:LuxR C-terminal-related transcriptional regulator [Streptomyces sp. NBC_01754]WSC95574.1 LuxR C-terminal-related transcriptional regulator [Streptomyces sp. NBC_01754]